MDPWAHLHNFTLKQFDKGIICVHFGFIVACVFSVAVKEKKDLFVRGHHFHIPDSTFCLPLKTLHNRYFKLPKTWKGSECNIQEELETKVMRKFGEISDE